MLRTLVAFVPTIAVTITPRPATSARLALERR
jgi:hypothetical protein